MPRRRYVFDRPAVRIAATLGVVLLLYYAVPIGKLESTGSVVFAVCGLLLGAAALAFLITRQVARQIRAPEDEGIQAESLMTLLFLVVAVFAAGYFGLARSNGEFVGLDTKTDSLYFTISTAATVGFGDIHAESQLARALVTLQMVFDVVFVAALVGALTGSFRHLRPGELRGRAEV